MKNDTGNSMFSGWAIVAAVLALLLGIALLFVPYELDGGPVRTNSIGLVISGGDVDCGSGLRILLDGIGWMESPDGCTGEHLAGVATTTVILGGLIAGACMMWQRTNPDHYRRVMGPKAKPPGSRP